MFQSRISLLIDKLKVKKNVIAQYSNINPSSIGRYISGDRSTKKDSPSADRLVKGFIRYADDTDKLNIIFSLLEADTLISRHDDLEYLEEQLKCWLFFDSPETVPNRISTNEKYPLFAKRLGEVMDIAELSNAEAARLVNTDPSQISKFRRGHRTPKPSSGTALLMCRILTERIEKLNRTDELIHLIGAPDAAEKSEDILLVYLQNWLYDIENENQSSIGKFLKSMDSFTSTPIIELPSYDSIAVPDIINDTGTFYIGESGLQNVVIRFLVTAIESGVNELYLYSDQDMGWITSNNSFRLKWLSLMTECVRHGIKIKIIHNIDRSTSEMLDAIRSWLPLYMSGMVEPYYSTLAPGQRFSHTVFLCPQIACITAATAGVASDSILYDYHTDIDHLQYFKTLFDGLMKSSRLLVRMRLDDNDYSSKKGKPSASDLFNNIRISLNKTSVVINHATPPTLVFYNISSCIVRGSKDIC